MMLPKNLVPVADNLLIAPGVYLLTLNCTDDFLPGQVISIKLPDFEVNRLYSLCNGQGEPWQIIYTVVNEGSLTPKLSELKSRDLVMISEPFGSFQDPKARQVWVANGTGIAPFRSFYRSGAVPERLIYGGRSPESFYFSKEWERLGPGYCPCSSVFDSPGFYSGRLTSYIREENWDPELTFLLCGSAPMIVEVRDILIQKGIGFEKILSEIYF